MKRNDTGSGDDRIIPIVSDLDIIEARTAARSLALFVGFDGADLVMIATAVSELARNIVRYGYRGEVVLSAVQNGNRRGVEVVARDQGPGIADTARALTDGFSTSRSLGMGLPGTRRLMDDFKVESQAGLGTTVTVRKWLS